MNSNFLKVIFTAAFLFFLYTAMAKILRAAGADTLLTFGLIVSVCCFAFVLYEVISSRAIKRESKLLWVAGFFVMGWPVMLFYVFAGRSGSNKNTEPNLRTA